MAYSRKFRGASKLEDMQDERQDLEGDDGLRLEVQSNIDEYFFGPPKRIKTRKEKKKERRLAKQKYQEEEY